MKKYFPDPPVVFARVLLDQLQSVLLGEQHEAVHGPLGLVRVLGLLGGGHWRRHHRARHGHRARGAHSWRQQRGDAVAESEARGGHGSGVSRQRDPASGRELVRQLLAGNRAETVSCEAGGTKILWLLTVTWKTRTSWTCRTGRGCGRPRGGWGGGRRPRGRCPGTGCRTSPGSAAGRPSTSLHVRS